MQSGTRVCDSATVYPMSNNLVDETLSLALVTERKLSPILAPREMEALISYRLFASCVRTCWKFPRAILKRVRKRQREKEGLCLLNGRPLFD